MRRTAPTASAGVDREHEAVLRHIDRWLGESLITESEALALRHFEMQHATEAARRVPMVAEVLAYLGAALALAAGLLLFGNRFEELSRSMRMIVPAVAGVVFFAAGWPLHRHADPSVGRLAGALWLLATGAFAGFMAEALFDVTDQPAWALLALGVSVTVFGGALMLAHPTGPTHIGAAAGAAMILPGVVAWWDPADQFVWTGLSFVLFGWLWLALGRTRAVKPATPAFVVGTVTALYGPVIAAGEDFTGEALLIGSGVAVALLVAGVWLRSTPVLALAAIGTFGFLFASILWFLQDTLGAPLALLLGGVSLLVVAWVTLRLGNLTRRRAQS